MSAIIKFTYKQLRKEALCVLLVSDLFFFSFPISVILLFYFHSQKIVSFPKYEQTLVKNWLESPFVALVGFIRDPLIVLFSSVKTISTGHLTLLTCTSACLYVYVCAVCGPGAFRGCKRALDSLELEFQMIVSHHVGPGDRTQVLCKSKKCSYLLSHLSSPKDPFFFFF